MRFPSFAREGWATRSSLAIALSVLLAVSARGQTGLTLEEAVEQARAAQNSGDYAAAAKDYRRAAALSPDIAELWANLGLVEHLAGQYTAAIEDFRHAVHIKPSLFVPNLFLGVDLVHIKQPAQAIPYLLKAEALKPDDPQTPLTLGHAYAALRNTPMSTEAYRKAVRINPNHSQAWFDLGISYIEQMEQDARALKANYPHSSYLEALVADSYANEGRYLEGENAYIAMRHAAQRPPCVNTEYALLLQKAGKTAEAHNVLAQLASLDPECPLLQLSQARLQIESGQVEDALDAPSAPSTPMATGTLAEKAAVYFYSRQYEAASQTARQLVKGHIAPELGLYWAIRANQRLAVSAMDRAGDLDPNSASMNVLLGDVYRKLRRYGDAEKYYRRALAADQQDLAAQIGLCTTQFMAGNLDEALATGKVALTLSPSDPELNLLIAEVLVKQRNYTAVMAYLQQSLNVNKELLPRVHALRGQVLAAQGQVQEATRELELASVIDNDGSIHYQLALLYRKQGEAEKASATMKESQQLYLDHRTRVAEGLSDVAISPAVQAEVQ